MTDDWDEYTLWVLRADRTTHAMTVSLGWLIDTRRLSPAARSMSEHDIMHQFNNVNGGEEWLMREGDTPPKLALRTETNPDGSEPEMWAFYIEADIADSWLEAGQVDQILEVTR